MIVITSDWSAVEHELDRLAAMPTAEMTAKLNGVLAAGFALTQAAVHVESGALKASGRMETNRQRILDNWQGEITYGDERVVDYAIYEKRRGIHWVGGSAARGDHDFMRPLDALQPLFTAAIIEGLT